MQISKSWFRGSVVEWVSVIAIFLATISGLTLYVYPIYYEFDVPGEMVALEEIGIDSSVHFMTVYSGVTESFIALYLNDWYRDPDSSWYRIEPYYARYLLDEEWDESDREDSIANAFDAVMGDDEYGEYEPHLQEVLEMTEGMYGNSLGLMVAIGLEEERSGFDFSQGGRYRIAGTGSIESDYTVGSIGALEQKMILAEQQGVTHFFVPRDYEWYGEESNEAEAVRVAEKRGLTMQIIPVATLSEAVDYLVTNLLNEEGHNEH